MNKYTIAIVSVAVAVTAIGLHITAAIYYPHVAEPGSTYNDDSLVDYTGLFDDSIAAAKTDKPEPFAQQSQTASESETANEWDGESFSQVTAGTDIDGGLPIDEHGNLVPTIDVRDFFDYFLSAVGEVPAEQTIAEIERQIQQRLPPEAARQALTLLQDYIAYQQELSSLMTTPLAPGEQQDFAYYARTMRDTYRQIQQLRRSYFPPDVQESFFGLDEAYGNYAVSVMEVRADQSLSEAEQQQAIEQLENLLPKAMRTAHTDANRRAATVRAARDQFQLDQDNSQVREILKTEFDPQTIDQMLVYYEQEAKWDARLQAYLYAKSAINEAAMAETDRQSQLTQLRLQYFAEEEIPRLQAEEAIAEKVARYASQQNNNES